MAEIQLVSDSRSSCHRWRHVGDRRTRPECGRRCRLWIERDTL